MATNQKRQFVKLLPVVNQTTALTRFFGSTVDQVFQPGSYQPMNGYVGMYPPNYDPNKDFYVAEPTEERKNFQLDPGMVSIDQTTALNYSLTYPDLVGYLSAQGANVRNQSRMFESDFYVWSPPIDIDKITNFHSYYWFGDYTGAADLPTLTLTSPMLSYLGDGGTSTFALPASIAGIGAGQETIAAYVNSVPVTGITIAAGKVTLPLAPLNGDSVVVTRHDDLSVAIIGQTVFKLAGLIDPAIAAAALTSGMRLYLRDTLRIFAGWSGDVTIAPSNTPYQQVWDSPYLSDESNVHDRAGWDRVQHDTFLVEGVGRTIRLTPDDLMQRQLAPQHVTIDRTSVDGNGWSHSNNWVHRDSFAWSGLSFAGRQAKRPIIEFVRDIQLYNYGTRQIDAIDGVLSTATALMGTTPVGVAAIPGQAMGSVTVDDGAALFPGMRLLIAPKTGIGHTLYLVGQSGNTITLTTLPQAQGDTAKLRRASGYGAKGIEMHFDAGKWVAAQSWAESSDPLFAAYDIDAVSLDDPTRYHNSTFKGNRIFGFAAGTGRLDSILKRPVKYESTGYIQFENDFTTRRATTILNGIATEISGLYCYATAENGYAPTPLWHKSITTTRQDVMAVGADGTTYFNVPQNLRANPNSTDVTFISASEWSDHFQSEITNQVGFVGNAKSDNNFRDTVRDLSKGTQIVQHVSPLLKVMLLAAEPNFDFLAAVRYVDREYNLFRAKFSRKLIDLDRKGLIAQGAGADAIVGQVLASLKIDRNASFPFASSTMAGGNYFIPATPTFLGLFPRYQPLLLADDTYPNTVSMIRGHDGSLTPAFGDWRDAVFVAFEQRIHDSIPAQYASTERPRFDLQYYLVGRFSPTLSDPNASTTNYADVGYARSEVQNMLAPMFERWAQEARFDYRTNGTFDPLDAFTWNYRGSLDLYGTPLPGHWKAIYRWYFDTDRPHSAPWEMLGFTDQPAWWATAYGPAPYGAGNTMWADLERGVIRFGTRAGTSARYTRPGLSVVIPVDKAGTLLDPMAAGIIPMGPDAVNAARPWINGDAGPAENAWITSPAYRYALTQIAFLTKPSRLIEIMWDNTGIGYSSIGSQWIELATNQRPRNGQALIHGEIAADGKPVVIYGVQQWLSDALVATGKAPRLLGDALRSLDVRLIHRMASFVTADNLRAVSDTFGILPAEDAKVILYSSPNTRTETYSGVIVEWVGTGYRVVGYDSRNPYFSIIPSDTFGPNGVISLATTPEPVIESWHPRTYYQGGQVVSYKGNTYRAIKQHMSNATFEPNFWSLSAESYPQAPRVIQYFTGLRDTVQVVPYGHLFHTLQQVADFLLSYERFLISRGWDFSVLDEENVTRDWVQSVRDFLVWSQVQWSPGNFIALSPGASTLRFRTLSGTILNVENSNTGFFGLLDRSGGPINSRDVLLSRLDGDLSFIAKNADIFSARVRIADIEHALVFSNVTIFNDIIYLPLYDMRQARLKLIGNHTANWVGRLDAPGFIVSGNRVVPSFDRNVEDIREMFDIEKSSRKDFTDNARHLIGYQPRQYLENLLLAEVEQFEFYQGMIQQKGAPGVFEKLIRSQRVNADSKIVFLEEYAIRVARFGGSVHPRIAFLLNQSSIRRNPSVIRLGGHTSPDATWINIPLSDPRWLDRPAAAQTFFPLLPTTSPKSHTLLPAGPVRLNEVSYTAFYDNDLPAIYNQEISTGIASFVSGSRVWTYDDYPSRSWTVFGVFELGSVPNSVTRTTTSKEDTAVQGVRLYFSYPHGLTAGDIGKMVVVDGLTYSSPEVQGIQVIVLIGANWIEINSSGVTGYDFAVSSNGVRAMPTVRILHSLRFATVVARDASTIAFREGDMAWIDHDPAYGQAWSVYSRIGGAWMIARVQPQRVDPSAIDEAMLYDISTQISKRQITINKPILEDLVIVDPLAGYLPGVASREIDFQSEYDPANYTNGFYTRTVTAPWGSEQLGRVWWDISKVRYLDPYTDVIGINDARDYAEINYRTTNWAKIAPKTSIDVYEWIRSDVPPTQYTTLAAANALSKYTGVVYSIDDPSYTQTSEYSPEFNRDLTYYYFWVKNITAVPNVPFRKKSVSQISQILESPTAQDIPWFAPIMQDGMIVSGLAPYLNDHSTALKIQVNGGATHSGHDEWMLVRPKDERSLPPDWLWRKMTNGLAGFDGSVLPLPSPSLHPTRATGILQGQNVFRVDRTAPGDRIGLLDARESFVGMVNAILARTPVLLDRPAAASLLARSNIITDHLIWMRPDNSYIIEPPPAQEYDYRVFSVADRNRLLQRPEVKASIAANRIVRVLIDGTALAIPQWSIWWLDPAAAASANGQNYDTIFSLAPAYEVAVASHADRNLLVTPLVGSRILVSQDETYYGFSIVYRYQPNDPLADAFGYTVYRVQTYRTNDFYRVVDWYQKTFNNGLQVVAFSANKPPQVRYIDVAQRDAVETSTPANLFVEIRDLTGEWYWQYFANGIWNTVARSNSTIALSGAFFDVTRVVHAVGTQLASTIGNRDGSWEIKALSETIRKSGILTDLEVNELFFSLVHFVHSQQDDVDWVFKTSFMVIAGYSVPLLQTAVASADITPSLIEYVNEVKPYHVKIRDYAAQYTPPTDEVRIRVTDFDKPVDGTHRLTDLNATDLTKLQTAYPWKDWWDSHNLPMAQDATGFWTNPVRHMKVTMLFDRVSDNFTEDTWDGGPFEDRPWDGNEDGFGTASERIRRFYNPLPGMPAIDPAQLINDLYRFPAVSISGTVINQSIASTTYDAQATGQTVEINPMIANTGFDPAYGRINPTTHLPSGNFINPDRPEERVALRVDDSVVMTVTAKGIPGAPAQHVRAFDMTSASASPVLDLGIIPQSLLGVIVHMDGLRATYGIDYTLDYFGKHLTPLVGASHVAARSLEFGGYGEIIEQHFITYDATHTSVTLVGITPAATVEVTVDGVLALATDYVVTNTVTFTTVPALGADIVVTVWDRPTTLACRSQVEAFPAASGVPSGTDTTYALTYPDTQTIPSHGGTIVELDGKRLAPPPTLYGPFNAKTRFLPVGFVPGAYTGLDLFIDGAPYLLAVVPRWTATSATPTGLPFNLIPDPLQPVSASLPGGFVLYADHLVATDPAFMAAEVIAVVYEASLTQYAVAGTTLLIGSALAGGGTDIVVTTFSNARVMGIKTRTFAGNSLGEYEIPTPFADEYSMVSLDGLTLTPELDYEFASDSIAPTLTIPNGTDQTGKFVVATMFTGRPAHGPQIWRGATVTPSLERMTQALTPDGRWLFDLPRYPQGRITNALQVYSMDDKWHFSDRLPEHTGALVTPLAPTDTQIVVQLGLDDRSTKLWPISLAQPATGNSTAWQWVGNAFPAPDPDNNRPGVVWVAGERIEYLSLNYSPASYAALPAALTAPQVILGNIRRGTHGTSTQNENRITSTNAADGLNGAFTINAIGRTDIRVLQGSTTLGIWQQYLTRITGSNASTVNLIGMDHYYPNENDFTMTVSTSTTYTLVVPPPFGSLVVLCASLDDAHPVGTLVSDGASSFRPLLYARHDPSRLAYETRQVI